MTYLRTQNISDMYIRNIDTTSSGNTLYNIPLPPHIIYENELKKIPKIDIESFYKTNENIPTIKTEKVEKTKKLKLNDMSTKKTLITEIPPIKTKTNRTKPHTKPTTKPHTKPTTNPTMKPTTNPTTKPTTKPITNPTTKPITNPTTKSTTNPTTIVSSEKAYVTYHSYYENQPLTSVACSNGQNGLIQQTGYTSLTNELWPYVTAWSDITWNSPKCGSCIKLQTDNGNSINVIAIDGCGKSDRGETHFDVSEISFLKLFSNKNAGSGYVSFSVIDAKNCGINF